MSKRHPSTLALALLLLSTTATATATPQLPGTEMRTSTSTSGGNAQNRACLRAAQSGVAHCTDGEFETKVCSGQCQRSLLAFQEMLQEVCEGVAGSGSNAVLQAQRGGLVRTVCSGSFDGDDDDDSGSNDDDDDDDDGKKTTSTSTSKATTTARPRVSSTSSVSESTTSMFTPPLC